MGSFSQESDEGVYDRVVVGVLHIDIAHIRPISCIIITLYIYR